MRHPRRTQTGSHLEEWAALLGTDISTERLDEDDRETDWRESRDECA